MSRSRKKFPSVGGSYSGQKNRKTLKLDKKIENKEYKTRSKDTLKKIVLDSESDILFPTTRQKTWKYKFYKISPMEYRSRRGENGIEECIETYKKYLRK